MSGEYARVPVPQNETPKTYTPGSADRNLQKAALDRYLGRQADVFMHIDGMKLMSRTEVPIIQPHDLKHPLGAYFKSSKEDVAAAVEAALKRKKEWSSMSFTQRAAIFQTAANLLTDRYRYEMNAATMLGQSKTVHQAEIDLCELADFWRFNVFFAEQLYHEQPNSTKDEWNSLDYPPKEGFIAAIGPFNFTCISGNLATAPAIMGNTVVWKPSSSQVRSADVTMKVLKEAGLPDGVINLVYPSGQEFADVVFSHYDLAGVNFTGSTEVYQQIRREVSARRHRGFPITVGETGGKNPIVAHESADLKELVTGSIRGGFEYQGQKCSAASRLYVPRTLWREVAAMMVSELSKVKVGSPRDFSNFMCAVINEAAFNNIVSYIDKARDSKEARIVFGGGSDKSNGYFIQPTVIEVTNPHFITMEEEIFGPVLTVYPYEPYMWRQTLKLVDETSPYALTASVFAHDERAIKDASEVLINAAGNLYINDKPTGAVVGRQPFGGSRQSGDNEKAGCRDYLRRWVSPRAVKRNLLPPTDWRYPYMAQG